MNDTSNERHMIECGSAEALQRMVRADYAVPYLLSGAELAQRAFAADGHAGQHRVGCVACQAVRALVLGATYATNGAG